MGITGPLPTFFYNLFTSSIDFLYMILVEAGLLVISLTCLVINKIGSNSPSYTAWGVVFMELLAQRCPTTPYMLDCSGGAEPAECTVCLCEFEEGEEVSELQCKHMLHKDCLNRWLWQAARAACPLCRSLVLEDEDMMEVRQAEWECCEEEEDWPHIPQPSWWKS